MSKKKKLEIVQIGTPAFPRLVIRNGLGEVFDGQKMAKDGAKAMVFVPGNDIAFVFNAVQEAEYQSYPLREFTVTLHVRVRAKEPFSTKDLAEYLERVTTIYLDQGIGTGPIEDSVVQLGVTWAGLTEKGGRS